MLWVDKYRPVKLEDLSYHPLITQRLQSLAHRSPTLPHLFVYGPSGAGKKTRITALLRQIYGPSATKLKLEKRTISAGSRTIDINMISSTYHIELSPSDAGLSDRYVIQDIIKEMASNKNIINLNATSNSSTSGAVQYKIVVLMNVDRLSKQAQAGLRRTMEKYTSSCRLILCCNNNNANNVMEPIKSRCLPLRIPAPTIDEVSICVSV